MPTRPPSICAVPGCSQWTVGYRCPVHTRQTQRWYQRSAIYGTKRWKAVRRQQLRAHPWCQQPECDRLASEVDHIDPLRADGAPFDLANLQSLCKPHHSAKTAREVGLGYR